MEKWTLTIECNTDGEYSWERKNTMVFNFDNLEDCAVFIETVQAHGVGEFSYNIERAEEGGAEEC